MKRGNFKTSEMNFKDLNKRLSTFFKNQKVWQRTSKGNGKRKETGMKMTENLHEEPTG